MNAAIYTRYSTDRQRETSLADQARVCQARADALGLSVFSTYSDDGVSGSTPVAHRPEGARLVADALAGRFAVLLVEGLDRLSRDMVEQERMVRRLEHRGIRIIGVADGYDSEGSGRKIHRTMRGLINEIYLDDLRHKTHRGLSGQLQRGGHAGGVPYGYRSVAVGDIHVLEVEPTQAAIVREIFTRYADGWSCQRIAADLNARGVPTARGGTWSVSALYGSPAKGSGVLNNELYVGTLVWNRSQWVKDPDTGKRTRLDRPREEWVIEPHPELRIVEQPLWDAVRARFGRFGRESGGTGKGKRPTTLFGGLLRCGKCGGAIIATSGRHYGCAQRKDRGPAVCSGVTARRVSVDSRLLGDIRAELASGDMLAAIQTKLRKRLEETRAQADDLARAHGTELEELDKQIGNLVDAISKLGLSPALSERLAATERRREDLQAEIARIEAATRVNLSRIPALYRQMAFQLERALKTNVAEAREVLRPLIDGARVVEEGGQVWVESETGRAAIAVGLSLGMVAGARFMTKRRTLVS
jgi:DNA invertase Pin-like site-specific DNA recombinase